MTDTAPSREDPRARIAAGFAGRRGWQLLVAGVTVTLMVTLPFYALSLRDLSLGPETAKEVDFIVFWGAARLALADDPVAALDPAVLAGAQGIAPTKWLPWVYPPGFLAFVTPLGLLPFWAAWPLFAFGSLLAFALALRPISGGVRPFLLGFALCPAVLPALLLGQTTLLWLAGLVTALVALGRGREVLAGVLIGLLTMKPQLGLLIPVALVAGGHWRAFWAASATAVAVAVLPTLWTGPDYWTELLGAIEAHRDKLVASVAGEAADLAVGPDKNRIMLSPFSLLMGVGVPRATAMAAQWAITALAALAVWRAWRRPDTDLRAGTLLAAIAVATPYFWYYEALVLVVAVMFLWRGGVLRPGVPAGLLVVLVCFTPGAMMVVQLFLPEISAPFREVSTPVALVLFALAVLRAGPSVAPAR